MAAKHRCARCGKEHRTTETMLYSSWTGLRYCAYNLGGCERRAAANKRALARMSKAAAALEAAQPEGRAA